MWIKLDDKLINMDIFSELSIYEHELSDGEKKYMLNLYHIENGATVLASSYDHHSINVLYEHIIKEFVAGSPVCDLAQLMKHKVFSGGGSGNVDQAR